MSQTVDLFLDSDQPLPQVASQLSDLIGAQLVASPDHARFVVHDGKVTAYLSEHDFLDDDDLPLSAFRYMLSVFVRPRRRAEDSPELAWLRRVNSSWQSSFGLPSLLVIDLERPDVLPASAG
ncbi:MAG TPA: hypothetical protein VEJ84_00950 [Acidimicrobiales bacterium]|nr:hypothetical protein [Acidimicrobiales bacterium]